MKVSTGEAEISVRPIGFTVKLVEFPLKVPDQVVPSSIIVHGEKQSDCSVHSSFLLTRDKCCVYVKFNKLLTLIYTKT